MKKTKRMQPRVQKPIPVGNDMYYDPQPTFVKPICVVKLNGFKCQVVEFKPKKHSPWGFAEDARQKSFRKKGSRLPMLGYANNIPPAVQQETFMHECFHGWFGRSLSEQDVEQLTKDIWRAMQAATAARMRPARKRSTKKTKSRKAPVTK